MRRIEVENPRHRHIGLKALRTFFFLCFALVPVPPLAVLGVYVHYAKGLPELRPMSEYYAGLKAPTTLHAADGQVIGEFFEERRLFLPIEQIPIRLIQAFLSAEDERFFEHQGVDPRGIVRAAWANLTAGRAVQGASTLTQQLAKAMIGNEKSLARKVREAILARRMEDIYSKSEILTLYLNQIFLGHNSYGVQAAAQNYFRKSVGDLTLGELAILAILPPSPSTVNPVKNLKETLKRRGKVLKQMVRNGYISAAEAKKARREPVTVYPLLDEFGERAPYVAEALKEEVEARYAAEGKDGWLKHGARAWATAELDLGNGAEAALVAELEKLDQKQGYRGPVGTVTPDKAASVLEDAESYYLSHGLMDDKDLRPGETYVALVESVSEQGVEVRVTPKLGGTLRLADMRWAGPYREFPTVRYEVTRQGGKRVVTKLDSTGKVLFQGKVIAPAAFADDPEDRRTEELHAGELDREGERWTIERKDETAKVSWKPKLEDCTTAFEPGDAVLVRAGPDGELRLTQQPKVQGAVLTWDPYSGYVRAMVGGSDFDVSQVNRVHALRQTGSTMKPIYYGLAYDLGLRPSSPMSDAPYARGGFKSAGGSSDTHRMLTYVGLAKSRNTVSLRVHEYVTNHLAEGQLDAWRTALGLAHPLRGHRSEILGGDQTMWSMSTAFSKYLSGGLRTEPTLVRKIVDKDGRVIEDRTFFGDATIGSREMLAALYETLYVRKPRVLRESVAYLMRSNLRATITMGTAHRARELERTAGGKTGTLPFDIWFNGFTGDAMTAVWMGEDRRERLLGRSKGVGDVYGAGHPLTVFMDVARLAGGDREVIDFLKPVPPSIEMVTVDPETGNRALEGGLSLPHRQGAVPLYVHRGEGSTDDIHHSETDF